MSQGITGMRGNGMDSTDENLVPAIITVTWSQLEATADDM